MPAATRQNQRMVMLDGVAHRVADGQTVEFRPTGSSMVPLIRSRQLVVVGPADPAKLEVGDIVLARVAGTVYLHLVSAVDRPRKRVQISNNRGRVNGWTNHDRVYGVCLAVDGVRRPGAQNKLLGTGTGIKATPLGAARLELLPLRVEHADEMAVALSDASLHTFIGGTPAMEQELRVRYERMVTGSPDPAVSWCNWVLRLRDEARLVGTVQATIGPSGEGTEAEIAWVVGVPWQRRGFATEAAQRLVVWLEQLPVQSLVAHIHPDHQASASIASAIGLSPTGQWQDGEVRWERAVTVRPRRRDEGHP